MARVSADGVKCSRERPHHLRNAPANLHFLHWPGRIGDCRPDQLAENLQGLKIRCKLLFLNRLTYSVLTLPLYRHTLSDERQRG